MLFKSVLRTFKSRFIQLIGIGLLVLMSSLFYTAMNYAIDGIKGPTDEFFNDYKQEEFSIDMYPFLMEDEFSFVMETCNIYEYYDLKTLKEIDNECYRSLMNRRIKSFEDEYSYSLELREYKDIISNSHTFRFMNDMKNVNLSFIEEGTEPLKCEIALTKIYAKKNNISIGDTITILDKTYKVSGFVLFPDFTFPLYGDSFIFDNAKQSTVLVDLDTYENLVFNDKLGYYLSGYGNGDFEELKESYPESELDWIAQITHTENQLRSGGIYTEIKGGKGMAVALSLVIATLSITVVGIIVNRIIQKERNQIGLLKGMGYTNREITTPYIVLLSIISLPMLVIGYYVGLLIAEPFKNIYLEFYLLPSLSIEQSLSVIAISVVLPFTFIILLAYLLINFLLRATPLEMMSPKQTKVNKYITYITKYLRKFNIITRFKYSLVFQSMGKFMVFIIGIFYATILLVFSFMTMGTLDRLVFDYYESVEYEYEGYCNFTGCPEISNGEYAVILPSASYEDQVVTLLGLEPDNELHKLYNKRNKDITSKIEDGAVITGSLKLLKGVSIGDEIEVSANNETFVVKVVGVADIYTGNNIYLSRSYLNDQLFDDDFSNMVYSKNELNDEDFMTVSSKSDVLDQAELMQKFMDVTVLLMIVISGGLGFIVLFIIMSLTVEDNFYIISLLKVMGFNKKEVNNMVVNSYLVYSVLAYLISIPISYGLIKVMEIWIARSYNMIMVFELNIWYMLLGLAIVVTMYLFGTIDAKRKIDKISLQESLKMYQE